MFTVKTEGTWTKQLSERRILGNFMESGFGRQIPGMWSEMVYNRAFREIPPYTEATWEWLGLDKEHYNEICLPGTADTRNLIGNLWGNLS